MTVSSNTPVAINTLANIQNIQQANNTAPAATPRDRAEFSEAAKQLGQESMRAHSQSGASGTWSQPTSTTPTAPTNMPSASSTNDLQSLLMKSILSAYGSTSQNGANNMSLMA